MITLDDIDEAMSALTHAGEGFSDEYYTLARVRHGMTSAYLRTRPTQDDMYAAVTAAQRLLTPARARAAVHPTVR